jgi:tetratricopeptide (TPR) repeat protein
MINKLLTLFCCVFIIEGSVAQAIKDQKAYDHWRNVFSVASKYGDFETAKGAVIHMMVLNENNIGLADTLANMYFEQQQFASCVLVCNDILDANPKYLPTLEMRAVSFENLGLKEKALPDYETIYLATNNLVTLYKIALIQRELNRFKESKTNLDIVIGDEKAAEINLIFADENNQQQEIPLNAAASNIKGLIEVSQSNTAEARKNFNKALELAPSFYLPKQNLADLGE